MRRGAPFPKSWRPFAGKPLAGALSSLSVSSLVAKSRLFVGRLVLAVSSCALAAGVGAAAVARAQAAQSPVLELDYTPAARAQVAIWIEDAAGNFLATVRLTEAVAFRGIGNRPGASEMNSGYRWPYGRREGVLPVWAGRRAAAPGAQRFPRVVFQSRIEGLASRTTNDQSRDNYYCLSFDTSKSARDALDAVSCASVFTSDKGRYYTAGDASANYGEPYEAVGTHQGARVPMPSTSLYPPRMDLTRCNDNSTCFDSADVAHYVADVRSVMPDIDAVTMATPPGGMMQSVLFTVPSGWSSGNYVAWLEINVEGDYDSTWSAAANPTPSTPSGDWDSWARMYGYPYRGQPSIVFSVPFTLGDAGEDTYAANAPIGRASWDVWGAGFGQLVAANDMVDDPSGAPGSGADRLRADNTGHRLVVHTRVVDPLPDPPPGTDAGTPIMPTGGGDAGLAGSGAEPGVAGSGGASASAGSSSSGGGEKPSEGSSKGMVIESSGGGVNGPIGPIYGLELMHDGNPLRAHTWIQMRFLAARSTLAVHDYEVRVATDPITDEDSFIKNGRQAKNATNDAEGATLLMVPTNVPAGKPIEAEIGDLVAFTHYYVGVRATDASNRHGPISVAEITTTTRRFATVTPCFIATAAYGTPLASEIGVLRQLRDRYLMPHALGRAVVGAYYELGPHAARVIAAHDELRAGVRAFLSPVVGFARYWLGR